MPLELAYQPIELPAVVASTAGELRPRDFAARIRRRDMRSIRRTLRAPSVIRQRLGGVAMFGIFALLLGPTGWGEPGGVQAAVARSQMAGLQPFERGGDSFPGSAFYWLDTSDSGLIAPTEAQAKWDQSHSDAEIATARPVMATGSSEDRWRALQCLTSAIYYEAASEPDAGQRAVAQVVLNRVRHPAFPKTVCGVVFQGSERSTGCQFTFSCDGALARWSPTPAAWARAREIAKMALHGTVFRPVGHATHYHTDWVVPYWSASLDKIVALHTHLFFRWAGWWGTPPAFNRGYVADEPNILQLARLSPAHLGGASEAPGPAGDPGATGLPFDVNKAAGAIPASAVPAAVAGDQNVFLVTLPDDMVPDLFPALALRTCGDRPYCKFMAWLDSSKKPARLPPTGDQAAAMSFSYLRDEKVQYVKALWNCEQFRRPSLAQCMRRQLPPAPAATPTPAATAEPAPLDGVRRKQPAQNKAGAAAPATPASSVPSSD